MCISREANTDTASGGDPFGKNSAGALSAGKDGESSRSFSSLLFWRLEFEAVCCAPNRQVGTGRGVAR